MKHRSRLKQASVLVLAFTLVHAALLAGAVLLSNATDDQGADGVLPSGLSDSLYRSAGATGSFLTAPGEAAVRALALPRDARVARTILLIGNSLFFGLAVAAVILLARRLRGLVPLERGVSR